MTTATMELYNALLDAGVSKDKAEAAAKAVISLHEAQQSLASKQDLADLKAEIYQAILMQTGAIVSIISVVNAILFFAG